MYVYSPVAELVEEALDVIFVESFEIDAILIEPSLSVFSKRSFILRRVRFCFSSYVYGWMDTSRISSSLFLSISGLGSSSFSISPDLILNHHRRRR